MLIPQPDPKPPPPLSLSEVQDSNFTRLPEAAANDEEEEVEALVAVEDWRRCRAAAVEGADLRLGGGGAPRFITYTNTSVGIRIRKICMFLGILDPDPLVRGTDPGSNSGSFPFSHKSVERTEKYLQN
jgi:hypothetical protein